MVSVIIRQVTVDDAQDIYKNCFVRDSLKDVEARIAQNVHKQKAGEIIQAVAVVDGCVVGTMVIIKQKHPLFAHRCELVDVVVNGEYQGRGIARKLFDYCVNKCKRNNIQLILTGVRGGEPAEKVYRKLGFIEYGRLVGGIVEPWNNSREYDEVLLYYRP